MEEAPRMPLEPPPSMIVRRIRPETGRPLLTIMELAAVIGTRMELAGVIGTRPGDNGGKIRMGSVRS